MLNDGRVGRVTTFVLARVFPSIMFLSLNLHDGLAEYLFNFKPSWSWISFVNLGFIIYVCFDSFVIHVCIYVVEGLCT